MTLLSCMQELTRIAKEYEEASIPRTNLGYVYLDMVGVSFGDSDFLPVEDWVHQVAIMAKLLGYTLVPLETKVSSTSADSVEGEVREGNTLNIGGCV